MGGTASNFASVSEYSNFFSQVDQACATTESVNQTIVYPVTLNNCKNVMLLLENMATTVFTCNDDSRVSAQQSNMASLNQSAKAGWFGTANNTSITSAVANVESYMSQNCDSSTNQQQMISGGLDCNNTDGVDIKEFNTSTSSVSCSLVADTSVVQSNSATITQKAAGVDPSSFIMTIVWVLLAIILVSIGIPILVSSLGKSAKSAAEGVGSTLSTVAKKAESGVSGAVSGATQEITSGISKAVSNI